jgi:hypothetical protein
MVAEFSHLMSILKIFKKIFTLLLQKDPFELTGAFVKSKFKSFLTMSSKRSAPTSKGFAIPRPNLMQQQG